MTRSLDFTLVTDGPSEDLPDPKKRLHDLLWEALELPPRRAGRFNVSSAVQRVGELIRDYSPLRELPAFRAFESEVTEALEGSG